MNLLYKQLLVSLLDDIAFTVGVWKWLALTAVSALVTRAVLGWGSTVALIICAGLTVNLALAAGFAVWWRVRGRDKHVDGMTAALAELQDLGGDES